MPNPVNRLALALICIGPLFLSCTTINRKPGIGAESIKIEKIEHFRLGWYDGINNLENIADIAEAGFDYCMPYVGDGDEAAIQTYVEAAERTGLDVFLEIPRSLIQTQEQTLANYVAKFNDSPRVIGWYLYDEPEWKPGINPVILHHAYTTIKEYSREKPVALVFMVPWLITPYREAMDELWYDFYPITEKQNEFSAFRGGKYAHTIQRIASKATSLKKPLTLVLQGFGATVSGKAQFGRRLPTQAETRYMLYSALLGRPSSILYWTYYRTDPAWVVATLSPLVREFRSRFPQALVYETGPRFRTSGGSCDTLVLGNAEGRRWLLAISHEDKEKSLTIIAPSSYRFKLENQDQVTITLPAFGVVLLDLAENLPIAPRG